MWAFSVICMLLGFCQNGLCDSTPNRMKTWDLSEEAVCALEWKVINPTLCNLIRLCCLFQGKKSTVYKSVMFVLLASMSLSIYINT